jgi:flavin-dependent dehydrogenase
MDADTARSTTVVSIPEDGWFWFIPMSREVTSVGIVAKRELLFRNTKDRDACYAEQLAKNPWIVDGIAGAEQVDEVHVTADYSYRSTFCADKGVVLAGDAFAFLDPVFSSGVFFALRSGEEAADRLLAALEAGSTEPVFFADYGEKMSRGVEAMRTLVYAFYDPNFSMGRLVRAHPELAGDATDLLIGDVFRDYTALFAALAEFATLPPALPHGGARL